MSLITCPCRRDGVVVRVSASKSVDLGLISPSRVIPKDFKKCHSQFACLVRSTKGTVLRTSRQAWLLCPWARHLTGCLHLHVPDRWWGQAFYSSWWPSPTEDSQTDHELLRSVHTSRCIIFSTLA